MYCKWVLMSTGRYGCERARLGVNESKWVQTSCRQLQTSWGEYERERAGTRNSADKSEQARASTNEPKWVRTRCGQLQMSWGEHEQAGASTNESERERGLNELGRVRTRASGNED
jgi:hypothetical protein